jgi:hypothetical protein
MYSSLPDIVKKIRNRLHKAEENLRRLGSGPSPHPVAETLALCREFESKLKEYTDGAVGCEDLVQANNEVFMDFKRNIRKTAPLFLPYTISEGTLCPDYEEPPIILEDASLGEHSERHDLELVRKRINE